MLAYFVRRLLATILLVVAVSSAAFIITRLAAAHAIVIELGLRLDQKEIQRRTHELKERFGPEYDRTVRSEDSQARAESELAEGSVEEPVANLEDAAPDGTGEDGRADPGDEDGGVGLISP